MRAAAFNPVSSRLVGVRVGWMLALGWGLAAAIGSVAGCMVAPIVFLDPNMMSGILLYAFAGALLGGIDSPLGAVLGGFAVGVIENLGGAYVVGTELKLTLALVIIVAVLTVKPSGLMGRTVSKPGVSTMRTSWLIALLVLLAAIVPVATFSDYHLFQMTMVVVYAIAILGLAMLIGFNGQISLGHGAFYAIGAYTTAILMTTWNVPYWVTLPISAVVCAVVGFLIGLPALRLAGCTWR